MSISIRSQTKIRLVLAKFRSYYWLLNKTIKVDSVAHLVVVGTSPPVPLVRWALAEGAGGSGSGTGERGAVAGAMSMGPASHRPLKTIGWVGTLCSAPVDRVVRTI